MMMLRSNLKWKKVKKPVYVKKQHYMEFLRKKHLKFLRKKIKIQKELTEYLLRERKKNKFIFGIAAKNKFRLLLNNQIKNIFYNFLIKFYYNNNKQNIFLKKLNILNLTWLQIFNFKKIYFYKFLIYKKNVIFTNINLINKTFRKAVFLNISWNFLINKKNIIKLFFFLVKNLFKKKIIKKVIKKIRFLNLRITITINNFFIIVTNELDLILFKLSGGLIDQGNRRQTEITFEEALTFLFDYLTLEQEVKNIKFFYIAFKKRLFIKTFFYYFFQKIRHNLKIFQIKNLTPVAHNGCRNKKKRRL